MQVSVCLGAILIPEYLDSILARSRIAGIYSGIHSYSGIFPNERAPSLGVWPLIYALIYQENFKRLILYSYWDILFRPY